MPNIPWQDRPQENDSVVWRYTENPVVSGKNLKTAKSIFNSAVINYENGFIGVFRVDDKCLRQSLHVGKSKDGIEWEIDPEPIKFISDAPESGEFIRGFDPRICFIEDRYYITWANIIEGEGSAPGAAYTYDFKNFYQLPNVFLLYNRNAVLFPRKINEKFALLNRPSAPGHCAKGSIFYSESPDMIYWGETPVGYVMVSRPNVYLYPEAYRNRRNFIRDFYNKMKLTGDKNVYFIDGYNLFDGEFAESCTADGCHPNDLGFYRMANQFGLIFEEIFDKTLFIQNSKIKEKRKMNKSNTCK